MSLPVNDERVLTLAQHDLTFRGRVTGFGVRDAYIRACRQGGFYPPMKEVGATASWTAALKRLERAGKLRRVQLYGRMGKGQPAGIGFVRPGSRHDDDRRQS